MGVGGGDTRPAQLALYAMRATLGVARTLAPARLRSNALGSVQALWERHGSERE